ncbi:hypothetical protein GCM10009676_40220 [Prauserella halophila]|uniref:Uncharacterized protein n=1 Tax=Prauserella halophila TaxID=185641 RepID=A0ABN1WJB1_9PSEU|nr:hypothetical protein [Prauserella halophila]MCP2236814.1 hypothetical protein [Prauserella halophila]
MYLASTIGLFALLLTVAAVIVTWEDRRADRRRDRTRSAQLAALGEVDPLASARFRADLRERSS